MFDMAKRETEREWKQAYARYEAERIQKERERERMQKEIQEEAAIKKIREQERNFLEDLLTKYLSKITEVNLIAKELKRNIILSVKINYSFISGNELTNLQGLEKTHKPKIRISVKKLTIIQFIKLHENDFRLIIKNKVAVIYGSSLNLVTDTILLKMSWRNFMNLDHYQQ